MSNYYRPLKAGEVATKALLDDREPVTAIKSATQNVNNSTTLTADTQLSVAVAANATYHVSVIIIFSGPAAADWRRQWAFPAGATGREFTHGPAAAVTSVRSTQLHARSAPLGTILGFGTDGSENSLLREEVWLYTAGTAGSLALTWSQVTATVGNTTVRTGSRMRIERVV